MSILARHCGRVGKASGNGRTSRQLGIIHLQIGTFRPQTASSEDMILWVYYTGRHRVRRADYIPT